jgi:hypothetical protein
LKRTKIKQGFLQIKKRRRQMSDLLEQIEPIAAEMRKELMNKLGSRITALVDRPWSELAQEIAERERALEITNAWRVLDQQSARILKLSCLLLAMYQTLLPLFEDRQELLDILKTVIDAAVFREGMEAFLLGRFGISSDDSPEVAWDRICKNFVKNGQERYGRAWLYEQGIRDQKRFFVNICQCGFADFFLKHGAREVLYLLCAADSSRGK